MFSFIKGELIEAEALQVVLEAQGIGYKIYIAANALAKLPQVGETVRLHTSFVVREFSHALYGFLSGQERDLFDALMNVSGIGPKLAQSIIGHVESHDLQRAIQHQDIPRLCKIPGIGKKTAERLIIELRDKLSHLLPSSPSDYGIVVANDPKAQAIQDAMSALVNLGYNQITAQKAIKKTLSDCPEKVDLPTLITSALKNI